jgi:hypothetical protein
MKHMKKSEVLRISGAIILMCLAVINLSAQPGSQHETVTVIGTYTPHLSEARKISFTPSIKDTIIPVPEIEYKIVSAPIHHVYDVKPIPPARVEGESFQKLYKNHIIAGFGNYWSPYLDFSHFSFRNKNFRGGFHLKHLSASGSIDSLSHPGYSENLAGITGSYIQDEYTLWSGLNYSRDAIHYYGFVPGAQTPEFENKDIKQVFQELDFVFGGASHYSQKERFHNQFTLKYQGLWDQYDVNEQNVLLNAGMKKNISLAQFLKQEAIYVDVDGGYFAQEYALQSISTAIAGIKPRLNVHLSEIEITVGGNLVALLDSTGEALFFPYGRMDIHIVPGSLGIFFGVDGSAERNTFKQLSEVNPFINTEIIPLEYTISRNILFGGINGGFGGRFNYRLMARNRQIENMPLFINDTLPLLKDTITLASGNRFDVVYDNADVLSLSLEIQLNFSKKFALELFSAYHIFSTETQAKAWHMPRYNGSLRLVYNLEDKISGKFNVFAYGDRFAFENDVEKSLKPVFDFNLEIEYRYTKFLSFWARFNNFTTKKHFYWNNYPTQSLNVMAGASYTF